MPVHKLLDEMTYEELVGWYNYFERRPIGWREDDRSAKVIQAQGVKAKAWDLFPSLAKIYKPSNNTDPVAGLKGSLLFHKMMSAKGGDKLDL